MNPLYPVIDIYDLSLLLFQWKQNKMSDAKQLKMLRLLLGREFIQCMDKDGRYPYHMFGTLRSMLKYSSNSLMLDDAVMSGVFVFLVDKANEITHFYSPLWHKYKPDDGVVMKGSFNDSHTVQRWDNYALSHHQEMNSLRESRKVIILNEVLKKEDYKEEKNISSRRNSPKNLDEVLPENVMIVKEFFHYLNVEDALRREFFTSLIDGFQISGYTREQSRKFVIVMYEDYLLPYLAKNVGFLSESDYARVTRLRNIFAQCQNNWLKHIRGASITKVLAEERASDKETKQQNENNRPLSDYEWEADGKRLYRDLDEGVVTIPQDAPPRPSADAYYDFYTKTWIQ